MKFFIFSALLILIIFALILSLSKSLMKNKEKMNPFECGFEPFSLSRVPFSLRFFKITLIFLIFDIEIIIILPSPMIYTPTTEFLFSFTLIFFIVISGLLYEWKIGTLNWIK